MGRGGTRSSGFPFPVIFLVRLFRPHQPVRRCRSCADLGLAVAEAQTGAAAVFLDEFDACFFKRCPDGL